MNHDKNKRIKIEYNDGNGTTMKEFSYMTMSCIMVNIREFFRGCGFDDEEIDQHIIFEHPDHRKNMDNAIIELKKFGKNHNIQPIDEIIKKWDIDMRGEK